MSEPFVIEGKLVLMCQEGGFARDGWHLEEEKPTDLIENIYNVVSNTKIGYQPLDDMVAEHFGVEYSDMGDRVIGSVRITIERLEDETP